ncbi:hypothetical protein HDV03_003493 [Kappamyces sp. JEL0829]|nr:hypothetical protein HDV03_003493 [Kappamyces sp. JEL0829]
MGSFVKTSGMQFVLNGKPFYFGGTNSFSLFYSPTADVDNFFADAVKTKSSVVRTWLFSDGRGYLGSGAIFNNNHGTVQGLTIVYFMDINNSTRQAEFNDDATYGLGRFDYVLKSARDHGVKLIVTLANNWNDFGGADYYVSRLGSSQHYHGEFFTSSAIKTEFKRYISHVLSRVNVLTNLAYKDDPTIMMVELMNEPRCVGSNVNNQFPQGSNQCSSATITSWADEMTTYIRGIDKNHLLAIGDEGFLNNKASNGYPGYNEYPNVYSNVYDGSAGGDFAANAKLSNVDVLGLHAYFDQWAPASETGSYLKNTLRWVQDHYDIAKQVNKPLYLAEYGLGDSSKRANEFPTIQKKLQDLSYGGGLVWILMSTSYGRPCSSVVSGKDDSFCATDPTIAHIMGDYNAAQFQKSQ